MPEDPGFDQEDQGPEEPSVPHDDIMKRLLDYQRQLREGEEEDAVLAGDREVVGTSPRQERFTSPPAERFASPTMTGHVVDIASTNAVRDPLPEVEYVSAHDAFPSSKEWAPTPVREPEGAATDEWAPVPPREPDIDAEDPWRPASDRDRVEAGDWAPPHDPMPSIDPFDSRVAGLERLLDRLQLQVGDLRQSFSDLAVACDRRLAAIEDAIAEARLGHTP